MCFVGEPGSAKSRAHFLSTKEQMKPHLVLSAVLLSACYEYSAFNPTQDTLGKAVRVQLRGAGTDNVARFVGPNAEYLDGNLAAMTDTTYTLSLADLGRRNGTEELWKGEPLTLSKADVNSIALRKASGTRSAGLAGLLLGGAFLVARAIHGNEGTIITKPGGTPGGR
jgi:hypothetical protein